MDIRMLSAADFPGALGQIPEPPTNLWAMGTLPPVGTKYLAVVGSRALSPYGRMVCEYLVSGLAGYPISIVSGLALGADACAHKAALTSGLHTIAIPGSGLDDSVIYPRANVTLAKDILKAGGALLSEQEPDHTARAYDFPSRNRIMVGIANAVLVIEAGQKSGTLITARLAADYNRELLCVPHRINDPHAFGPHLFLRLGATLVSEPIHILEALKLPPKKGSPTAPPADLEDTELLIWRMLSEPLPRDEIVRKTKTEAGEALTALVALELRGLIKEELGAWRRT